MYSTGLRYGPVAGFCECGDEPSLDVDIYLTTRQYIPEYSERQKCTLFTSEKKTHNDMKLFKTPIHHNINLLFSLPSPMCVLKYVLYSSLVVRPHATLQRSS
jgi:hypothetical protein